MNGSGFQYTLGALICLGAAALSGCNASDAQAQARQGTQANAIARLTGKPLRQLPFNLA